MFKELNRFMGFPQQFYVDSRTAFNNFESMFKDRVPFFVSTYKFIDEDTPVIDNLYHDIDSYFSIRIPYRNTKKLDTFFQKKDVPTIVNFSGGKGFHVYAIFKEQVVRTEKSKERLGALLYSLQKYITDKIGIEAYDDPTLGRIHFITRYPTSKYIRANDEGTLEWNGNYCRYLPHEDFEKGLKHISKIVKEPGIVPRKPRATMTLQEFASLLPGFKIMERNNGSPKTINPHKFIGERKGVIIPTIAGLGVPCLKEIALHKHPSHFERIELVAWLKYMCYTDNTINAFLKQLNWLDYKYKTTSYQISKIKARLPSCNKLREWGYDNHCKNCTLFRRK